MMIKKINHHQITLTIVVCLVACAILWVLQSAMYQPQPSESDTYIDPSLQRQQEGMQSVIVTAVDSHTAQQAITSIGGEVTSNLWLIDAAGGTIPLDKLDELANRTGIVSIVTNSGVESAIDQDPWEGWVTDRRNYDTDTQIHPLSGEMYTPPVPLPNGGVFAFTRRGDAMILNNDGSIRTAWDIAPQPHAFRTAPAIDPISGTIYIASTHGAFAIDSHGVPQWVMTTTIPYSAGVALATNTLFVASGSQHIYGLDSNDGTELWSFSQSSLAGDILAPPIVANHGPYSGTTMYIVSENGHLTALDESGNEQWTYIAPSGTLYNMSPQVDISGTVYIAAYSGQIYAINPANGQMLYQYTVPDTIEAQPALSENGYLYVATTHGQLLALNPNGQVHFDIQLAQNITVKAIPVLSTDASTIYIASKTRKLFAINANDGSQLWQHETASNLETHPILARNSNIHIGDKGGNYEILRASDGLVLYRYSGFDSFRQAPTLSVDEATIFFHDYKTNMVVLTRLSSEWDSNKPHVEITSDPNMYKVANPISIDMGADIAHMNEVTGMGVTIAVVDSGVHFDGATENTIGLGKKAQYLGQADFTGASNCTATGPSPDPCFTGYLSGTSWISSTDPYGHGSHVAGIIWNDVKDYYTGASLGMAPGANIISVRVLGDDGNGSYEDVIEGIQYVVSNTVNGTFNVQVMNLSLSGQATSPYFVDPLNRAVEEAWAAGIVVVAAAGNIGPEAESITVPGNDPYIITVGSLNSNRTPGYWADDTLSPFSSTGPTRDGFIKPEILAPGGNVVSYMDNLAGLVQSHPDYDIDTMRMFRMNGTSMATAVTSGAIALIIQQHPTLTPDQIKFRLMYTARTAIENGEITYSPLRQGMGRIWIPDAVFNTTVPLESANAGMDINDDLAHLWTPGDDPDPANNPDLAHHYQGPVQTILSDDGEIRLYYVEDVNNGQMIALGASMHADGRWLDDNTLFAIDPSFNNGANTWSSGTYLWAGGTYLWAGGTYLWAGGTYLWAGGTYLWAGGTYLWAGGTYLWAGGTYLWAGGIDPTTAGASTTSWIDDVTCASSAIPIHNVIAMQNNDIILYWGEHPLNKHGYDLHRSEIPYFNPTIDTLQATVLPEGTTMYVDNNIATGNSRHFYTVRSQNCDGSSTADSRQVGQFSYSLSAGN